METVQFDVDYPRDKSQVRKILRSELGSKVKVVVSRINFGRPPLVTIKLPRYFTMNLQVFIREMSLKHNIRLAMPETATSY